MTDDDMALAMLVTFHIFMDFCLQVIREMNRQYKQKIWQHTGIRHHSINLPKFRLVVGEATATIWICRAVFLYLIIQTIR